MWTWRWDHLRELHPALSITTALARTGPGPDTDIALIVDAKLFGTCHQLVVGLKPTHFPGQSVSLPNMGQRTLLVGSLQSGDGFVARGAQIWKATSPEGLDVFVRQQLSAIEAELRLGGGA
jgi:hypothetical protein